VPQVPGECQRPPPDFDLPVLDRHAERIGGSSNQGALPRLPHHDVWVRAVRSACHALVASHHAVRSIDLLGGPIGEESSTDLPRLTDLARRTASEYGIEASVSQVGRRPVLHLSTSRYV
jgi:hypothetical protein